MMLVVIAYPIPFIYCFRLFWGFWEMMIKKIDELLKTVFETTFQFYYFIVFS
jgi:hypothetical protein